MKEYEVTIVLRSLRFSLIADGKEEAKERAREVAIDNETADLLRRATYIIKEVEE